MCQIRALHGMALRSLCLGLVGFLVVNFGTSSGTAQDAWLTRFEPGFGNGRDKLVAFAVDPEGNSYLLSQGFFNSFTTAKINAAGEEQWHATVRSPNKAKFEKIVPDGQGGAYIGGFATIHYDAAGVQLFREDLPAATREVSTEFGDLIVVEDGAIVVFTIISRSAEMPNHRIVAIRYGPQGDVLWTANEPLAGRGFSGSIRADVDGDGNLFVGTSLQSCGPQDCTWSLLTIKLNAGGERLWAVEESAETPPRSTTRVAAGPDGSVTRAIGQLPLCDEDGCTEHCQVIRYDAGGEVLWRRELAEFQCEDLLVGPDGSAHVVGTVMGLRASVVKYDAGGNELWRSSTDPLDGGAFEAEGHLGAAGEITVSTTGTALLARWDASGAELWTIKDDIPFDFLVFDVRCGVSADGAAYFATTADDDVLIVKYDGDGEELWQTTFNTLVPRDVRARTINVDTQGNVYVGGEVSDDEVRKALMVKYSPDGEELWRREGSDSGQTRAAVLDGGDNIISIISLEGNPRGDRARVVKRDSGGRPLWEVVELGGLVGLAVDPSDNVYVALINGVLTRVLKLDPAGQRLWNPPAAIANVTSPISLATSGDGHVALSGYRPDRIVTVKYDPDGNELWRADTGTRPNEISFVNNETVVDDDGNVFVVADLFGGETVGVLTVKYDTGGAELWRRSDGVFEFDRLGGAALASDGSLYVGGTANCGGFGCNGAVIRYAPDGAVLWRARVPTFQPTPSVSVDAFDNVYVSGGDAGTTLTARFTAAGQVAWVSRLGNMAGGEGALDAAGRPHGLGTRFEQLPEDLRATSTLFSWKEGGQPTAGPAPVDVTWEAPRLAHPAPAGEEARYDWTSAVPANVAGRTLNAMYAEPGRYSASVSITRGGEAFQKSWETTVPCASGDLSPWSFSSVGAPIYPGGARFEDTDDGPVLSVCAGGNGLNLREATDEFHFVEQELRGNVTLTVRLGDLVPAKNGVADIRGGQAGLMLRTDRSPEAPFVAVVFEDVLAGRVRLLDRRLREIFIRGTRNGGGPLWLRLERDDDLFTGSVSADGENWEIVESTRLALPQTLLGGMIAFGRDPLGVRDILGDFQPLTARFDNLSAALSTETSTYLRGDCDSDRRLSVGDAIFQLDFLFRGGDVPICPEACDVNSDTKGDIIDPVFNLNFQFRGGVAPGAPFPDCGVDPAPLASLGCARSTCE